ASAARGETTLDDIVASYRDHRGKLKSVLVEYDRTGRALVDRRMLYESLRVFDFPPATITAALAGEKRYSRVASENRDMAAVIGVLQSENPELLKGAEGDLSSRVPFDELERILPKIAPTRAERILIFDGAVVRERSPHSLKTGGDASPVYIVRDATAKPIRSIFPETYFDHIGYAAAEPGDHERTKESLFNELPDVLLIAPFVLRPPENIDGTACVVVEAAGYQKLWLDVARGFAVRKRQAFVRGELSAEYEFDDFAEVAHGVWMPRKVRQYVLGTGRVPNQYRAKRLIEYTGTIKRLEANSDAHQALFRLDPEPGAYVMDTTINPPDSQNSAPSAAKVGEAMPVVTYIQPADKSDLDKVVREARDEFRGSPVAPAPTRWRVVVGVGFLAFAVGVLLFYGMRGRRPEGQ
ncbi:MAG: hypothetical protein ACREHD_22045, partial [Pirellulales bacterium]